MTIADPSDIRRGDWVERFGAIIGKRGQIAVQGVHGHAVFGAAVGEQELVEFLEFFVGEGLVELHGVVR